MRGMMELRVSLRVSFLRSVMPEIGEWILKIPHHVKNIRHPNPNRKPGYHQRPADQLPPGMQPDTALALRSHVPDAEDTDREHDSEGQAHDYAVRFFVSRYQVQVFDVYVGVGAALGGSGTLYGWLGDGKRGWGDGPTEVGKEHSDMMDRGVHYAGCLV